MIGIHLGSVCRDLFIIVKEVSDLVKGIILFYKGNKVKWKFC